MGERTLMSATKLALAGRSLWAQDGQLRVSEPLAIIGMACRFPGGADSPESLWRLLLEGADIVDEVPRDRWDNESWFNPDPATPGKVSTRWGGFLDDIRGFDARFFGISPREAERMDPQQRVALEVACEALERAGLPLLSMRGSATGVFFSSYHNDYTFLQYQDLESVNGRTLTGTLQSAIPNRISHTLGLHGPSLTVDSACSSSLVGTHLACQALRSRDCDIALVGGVNLMITPHVTVALSRGGFMSPTGRCHTFDAGADGFVRSEGCGVIVLKRLADAIADGDTVSAVVRGSAVNQDGESTTLSAPNGLAQADMLRRALRNAGLTPDDISLLEAHGTGTELGDPIETDAVTSVFRSRSAQSGPLWLGSLKSNLGHMEAAAGVGGLIKAVLCLRHGTVPPHALLDTLSPHVDLTGTAIRVATEPTAMEGPRPRRAGVSSFGVGGTNAHVIVEEVPDALAQGHSVEDSPPYLLPLSARSERSFRELARGYAELLREHGDPSGVTKAIGARRSHYPEFRAGVIGATAETLLERLDSIADGAAAAHSPSETGVRPSLCFVFTGQGSQWPGMALGLAEAEPRFREHLEQIDAQFAQHGGIRPLEELRRPAPESRLERTDVAQATVFSVQVALGKLLADLGVAPAMVIGHSVGELAAAVSAGLMSVEEGVRAVLERGAAMQAVADQGGGMVAAAFDEAGALAFIAQHGLSLSVAAVNGPSAVTLAGPAEAVERAVELMATAGTRHTPLGVRFAFHSPQMAKPAEGLRGRCPSAQAPGDVTFVSTVTGQELDSLGPDYLTDNVRSPVRFRAAVERALELGVRHFVEIGPHPALGGPIVSTAEVAEAEVHVAYGQHRDRDAGATLLALIGRLYEWGCDLDWASIHPGPAPAVDLPTYRWAHEPHWLPEAPAGRTPDRARRREGRDGGGSFPGRLLTSVALDRPVFELDAEDPVFSAFDDHRVAGTPRIPATGLLELLRRAAVAAGVEDPSIVDVGILRAVEPSSFRRLQVVLDPSVIGPATVLFQTASGEWVSALTAQVRGRTDARNVVEQTARHLDGVTEAPDVALGRFYDGFDAIGLDFGPGYRLLRSARGNGEGAVGTIAIGEAAPWAGGIDPAVLDAGTQLGLVALSAREEPTLRGTLLPWAVDGYHVLGQGRPERAVTVIRETSDDGAAFDVLLVGRDDAPIALLEGWRLRSSHIRAPVLREATWEPGAVGVRLPGEGRWLIVGGESPEMGEALRHALGEAGQFAESVARTTDISVALREGSWDGLIVLPPGDADLGRSGGDVLEAAKQACQPLLDIARAAGAEAVAALRVVVVSRGLFALGAGGPCPVPIDAASLGITRALRSEAPELRCSSIDLDPLGMEDRSAEIGCIVDEALAVEVDSEVAIRDGVRRVHRTDLRALRLLEGVPDVGVTLTHEETGTLNGLVLRAQATKSPGPGEVTVRVLAAGLNFRDVLTALDSYDGPSEIGLECCGDVVALGPGVEEYALGDRVIGFWPGCFGSRVNIPTGFVAPAPAGMAPASAATLPVAYGTAWYGLHELGQIEAGQTVLIHAGAGGVGQAAVRLALAAGLRVFATAGSPHKRAWLERCGVEGAFDSRSDSFARDVLEATGGEGVDLVLNSLIGDLLIAGLRSLKPGGVFVELGKREVLSPDRVDAIRADVRYAAFDLREVADADPTLLPRIFGALNEAIGAGEVEPLRVTVLPLAEAETGFRQMARAQHIGKIVFTPPATTDLLDAGWTVLTGGTGGMGRATVEWLLEGGARRIAIWSRGGATTEVESEITALRAKYDAEIVVTRVDVSEWTQVSEACAALRASAPIVAVVHVAGVLDDCTLAQVSADRLDAVMRPKVAGAWNVHRATLQDPVSSFVLYSAVGPLIDGAGQGSYAAGNAFLDGLAVHRRGLGLPAVSVRWGLYRGGMAERLDDAHQRRWAEKGLDWLDRESGSAVFAAALTSPSAEVVAVRIAKPDSASGPAHSDAPAGAAELGDRLRAAHPHERMATALEHVRASISTMLGLPELADPDAPLRDLGLDSLSAIELRNALTVAVGESLPATLAFDYPTADVMAHYLLDRLGLETESARDRGGVLGEGEPATDIDSLSEEEAEALLLIELGMTPDEGSGP